MERMGNTKSGLVIPFISNNPSLFAVLRASSAAQLRGTKQSEGVANVVKQTKPEAIAETRRLLRDCFAELATARSTANNDNKGGSKAGFGIISH